MPSYHVAHLDYVGKLHNQEEVDAEEIRRTFGGTEDFAAAVSVFSDLLARSSSAFRAHMSPREEGDTFEVRFRSMVPHAAFMEFNRQNTNAGTGYLFTGTGPEPERRATLAAAQRTIATLAKTQGRTAATDLLTVTGRPLLVIIPFFAKTPDKPTALYFSLLHHALAQAFFQARLWDAAGGTAGGGPALQAP